MDSKRNQQQQGNNQSRPKQQQRQQGQQQAPQKPKQAWMTREQFEKSQNQEEDLGRRFNEQQYYQGQQVQQQQMFNNRFTYDQQFPQQNSYFPRQQYQQQQQQQQQYQWQRVNLAEERDQQTHFVNGTQNNRQQNNSYNNQYFVEKVGTDLPSIEDIFSRTTNSYANMPNQGQNGFPSFQKEGLSYQNNNFPPKNELKPKNNNNNSKNDNFRPKSSQQPANVKSTSNNPSNRVPEKPQQQQAGGAKGKQSDGNSKQNKSKQSMKQFDKVLQQMGSLFDTEEDLQLSQEHPKAGISNSGWECSSCGKLNWWLRKLCKTCGDFQVKICDRMQRLSPGEVEQFDYLFFIDYECNQTYNGGGSEIIEFPIVVVGVQQKAIVDTYEAFVKPDFKITKFITKLTTITNENVAKAPKLRNTISNVTEFLRNYTEVLSKPDRCAVVYDNKSDADFLHQETTRKKIKLPSILTTYINLKDVFPVVFSNPPRVPKSLADMQGILKQSFEGTQHRGIDDATNQANVGVECLARGYSFKKDMLLNINPQLLPKVQGESNNTHADVIIHLEFHIEMDNKIVEGEGEGEEESKDADEKETKKRNQDEENKNEDNSEDDAAKNHENPASNNSNTDTKKKSERKGKKPKSFGIDCIRSCSCTISEFDPKTKQFILSSHGVLTLEMFERSNLKESKKNANESTSQQDQEQEQAPATPEQLQVLQNVAIQIASFLQLQSSSLKSKRVILLTSNQSHKFVTSLLLDSCNQLSLKGDAEIDSATRILVMYLNYFALFKEEIYGIMRDSNNAARYVKQFKEISWSMNDFGRKSPEDKIKMVIEIQNSLINITGKCTLDRENVKKVLS